MGEETKARRHSIISTVLQRVDASWFPMQRLTSAESNSYFSNACHVPGIIVGTRDTAENETLKIPALCRSHNCSLQWPVSHIGDKSGQGEDGLPLQ